MYVIGIKRIAFFFFFKSKHVLIYMGLKLKFVTAELLEMR